MGRAEPARLLLRHAGIDFTDTRYTLGQWKDKKEEMPGKKVPILELQDGSKLGQSISILRYLGKKHGYYPEDALEAHKCDYLIDCFNDKAIGIALNLAQPEVLLKQNFNPISNAVPDWIEFLLPYLGDNKFLCGDKLTIADFAIAGIYTNSILDEKTWKIKDKWKPLMSKYPKFVYYGERFKEENIVHLKERTQTKF